MVTVGAAPSDWKMDEKRPSHQFDPLLPSSNEAYVAAAAAAAAAAADHCAATSIMRETRIISVECNRTGLSLSPYLPHTIPQLMLFYMFLTFRTLRKREPPFSPLPLPLLLLLLLLKRVTR